MIDVWLEQVSEILSRRGRSMLSESALRAESCPRDRNTGGFHGGMAG